MAFDEHLADLMRQALASRRAVVEKKMFGTRCWMLHGHMLCGVGVGRYLFRVGKPQYEAALARPGASVMDITGKPLSGFVWVDADAAIETGLSDWLALSERFVNSLPPK